jgi:hypothetical protein
MFTYETDADAENMDGMQLLEMLPRYAVDSHSGWRIAGVVVFMLHIATVLTATTGECRGRGKLSEN